MSVIQDAIDQLKSDQRALADPLEGLQDISHLNIQAATSQAVTGAMANYNRRSGLFTDAIRALEALVGDGYPNPPQVDKSDAAYRDAKEQERTVGIGAALFQAEQAANFTITFGQPTRK